MPWSMSTKTRAFIKGEIKVVRNEQWKKLSRFSYSKNMTTFEAFCQVISSSINLLFLKSANNIFAFLANFFEFWRLLNGARQPTRSLPTFKKVLSKRQKYDFDDFFFFWKYLTFNWSLAPSRQLEHWQWKKYLLFNISLLCSVVFNSSSLSK